MPQLESASRVRYERISATHRWHVVPDLKA